MVGTKKSNALQYFYTLELEEGGPQQRRTDKAF